LYKLAASLAVITLVACAASESPTTEATAGQVCTKEPTIGSNRLTTKCRTPEEVARDRAAAEQVAPSIRRSNSAPVSGSGG
jgi:hypothetical protein